MEPVKKLKILMLEDMESDAGLIEWTLRKANIDFDCIRVDTREEYIDGLNNYHPDVVLSDHSLPQFNSREAYKICKAQNLQVPFILVTGAVSEEFAVSCLKDGIDDYILKDNLTRLPVAIKNSLKQRKLEQLKTSAEGALKAQNVKLKKINRELDSFAYNVSHNLKAPLKSVLGLINLTKLENLRDVDQLVKMIDLIKESIDKLDFTLTNIINHSRNSRTKPSSELIDIQTLIEKCYDDLKFINGADSIKKIVNVSQAAPFYSDKYRLGIIINNLLSNSLNYIDHKKNEPYIKITVDISESLAKLTIEDNGIGIQEDQQSIVFDMFSRGTEISSGSGLGLYIVKEIITRLEGTISLNSKEGQGTSIQLIIPNMKKDNEDK